MSALLFDFMMPAPAPAPEPAPEPQESLPCNALRQLRASLDGTVAAKLMNATELIHALERKRRDTVLPTTLDALDTLLGGGLPRGKMVELTGRRASGRFSVVLSALAAATSMGEAAVLIDVGDHFDPQLAEENGVDLPRVLWVRPQTMKQAVMAAEMLAATGFQLIVLDAGLAGFTKAGRRAPDASWVRLARAAEAHGTALLISTPWPVTGTASEAVLVAERTRTHWIGQGRSPRLLAGITTDVRLEKHRHMKAGTRATLRFAMADSVDATTGNTPRR
ncbi:MAG TPA: hypothetical protein VFN10_07460 [Thermoanaerobaculia bacterium]|nr:hypothetical protein [Thermoanaerobaculia bacterium]